MLYIETVSSIMFDVSCLTVPTNISNLFIKANEQHNDETRFSSSDNFYINPSRLNQNQGSFARFGAKLWNSICDEFRQLPKRAFKKHINMLCSLLEAEDDYDESPIQYCAKVMRANFDEFRLLFSRIFDDMSAKFRAVFRVAQCDISKKMRRNYANYFEISK